MAKKETSSQESLQTMSANELNARLQEAQENQFRLKFRNASSPIKNPMEIRKTRREIARLLTILQQKKGKA